MLRNPCVVRHTQTKWGNIRIGCLTPAFSGAQKRAEVQRNTYNLRDTQIKGGEITIGYLTPTFSGAQKGTQKLCNPCLLGHTHGGWR